MTEIQITRDHVTKILSLLKHGLARGKGSPEPGEMCIEAVICYALGLPHGDNPFCVWESLRLTNIQLNDANWSSNKARANGLCRLALAQLGSKGYPGETKFVRRVVDYALRVSTPQALRSAASIQKDEKHKTALIEAANRCEKEATGEAAAEATEIAYAAAANAAAADANAAYSAAEAAAFAAAAADADADAAYAANAAAYAADAYAFAATESARDKSLADYAEAVVQILIELKAPGCQWLSLTEAA